MAGPEARIERKCVGLAEADGWTVHKIRFLDQIGAPDRFFVKDGRIILIEFKAPGEPLSPHQVLVHWELQEAGVEVIMIDSIEKFKQEVL